MRMTNRITDKTMHVSKTCGTWMCRPYNAGDDLTAFITVVIDADDAAQAVEQMLRRGLLAGYDKAYVIPWEGRPLPNHVKNRLLTREQVRAVDAQMDAEDAIVVGMTRH